MKRVPPSRSSRTSRTSTRTGDDADMSRWWGAAADRGDTERLEAFSDGVLAIAITLLILDVRVEIPAGTSLASALGHALPEIGAYTASFLQIGIMWANHHALFRVVDRADQLMLMLNLLLLGFVAFCAAAHPAGSRAHGRCGRPDRKPALRRHIDRLRDRFQPDLARPSSRQAVGGRRGTGVRP